MGILAFIPPILIGTAIVILVFPNFSLKGAWAVLTVCLGAGIGLGLTSATIFLWLAWIGRPAAAYLVFEIGSAILLGSIAFYRFFHDQSGSRNELSPDSETHDVPIKWLKRLVIILLLITSGSFGLKAFIEDPLGTVDTRIVWNYRARWMFRGGDLWEHAFYTPVAADGELIDDQGHAPDYPLLITGSVYRGWALIGNDHVAVPILIAGLFTFGSYLLLYAALALLRNRNQGYLAVLFMLVSTQFMHLGTDQYGDVPLAFFILSTIALFALKDRQPSISLQSIILAGFTAACAAWTKNEGLVFFALVILVRFVAQIGKQDWSSLVKEFYCFLLGTLPIMGTLIYFKLNFAPRNDLVNIYNLKQSIVHLLNPERYLIVISEILKKVYFFNDKIVILMALYLLFSGFDRSGKVKKHILSHVLLLLLMVCGYTFAYVITTYDLRWHIDSSLRRLFIQLWPAWVFLFFYSVRGPERSAKEDRVGVFKWL
jgi:4-amino-4-deoxy-L-arabinose transferase-like glycosyltransferase